MVPRFIFILSLQFWFQSQIFPKTNTTYSGGVIQNEYFSIDVGEYEKYDIYDSEWIGFETLEKVSDLSNSSLVTQNSQNTRVDRLTIESTLYSLNPDSILIDFGSPEHIHLASEIMKGHLQWMNGDVLEEEFNTYGDAQVISARAIHRWEDDQDGTLYQHSFLVISPRLKKGNKFDEVVYLNVIFQYTREIDDPEPDYTTSKDIVRNIKFHDNVVKPDDEEIIEDNDSGIIYTGNNGEHLSEDIPDEYLKLDQGTSTLFNSRFSLDIDRQWLDDGNFSIGRWHHTSVGKIYSPQAGFISTDKISSLHIWEKYISWQGESDDEDEELDEEFYLDDNYKRNQLNEEFKLVEQKYFLTEEGHQGLCAHWDLSTLGDPLNVYVFNIDGTTSGDNFDANLIGWDNWFDFAITISSPGISFNEALSFAKKVKFKGGNPTPLKKILETDGISNENNFNNQSEPTKLISPPLLNQSDELSLGWNSSEWFGSFYYTEHDWIYHSSLQWLYLHSFEPESVWLWSLKIGWFWTSADVFPFVYSNDTSSWFYFEISNPKEIIVYNYEDKSWVQFENMVGFDRVRKKKKTQEQIYKETLESFTEKHFTEESDGNNQGIGAEFFSKFGF